MTSGSLSKAAEADYLTEVLRRCGGLGDGRVSDVTVESSRATLLSQIIRLRLSYDGAAANAPRSIILKTGLPERANTRWNGGPNEVAFYTQIAAAMPERGVPRCFEARWDAGGAPMASSPRRPHGVALYPRRLADAPDLGAERADHCRPGPFSRGLVGRSASWRFDRDLARSQRPASFADRVGGVAGYERRALDEDYRLSVLWQAATPVWQAANDIPSWIWWTHLERIFMAIDDLGCRELLTGQPAGA